MEDERRWEDLKMDCLVKVFEKVGVESLLLDVPFVCKSWHKATLNPSCWKNLVFPEFEPEPFEFDPYPFYDRFLTEYRVSEDRFSVTDFIKLVVDRSRGSAVSVKLPGCCTDEAFEHVANVCPDLVILGLPRFLLYGSINVELIGKFKCLAILSLGCCHELEKILAVVSVHCKFLLHLILSNANVGKDEATAIVNLVPNIKRLTLHRANLDRDSLVVLLQGCKDLDYLDARDCFGFKEDDEEISQLASNIKMFMCEGSKERSEISVAMEAMMSAMQNFDFSQFATTSFAEVDGDEEEVDEEVNE
ncbi:hypothetical protein ACFX13_032272 [Malus domestica]